MAVKPRRGCAGCLISLVGYFLLGILMLEVITFLFAPWGFFMGGRFHGFPVWSGWGRLRTASGQDYPLFIRIWPRPGTRGYAHVIGTGILCTPRGEAFSMRVGADLERDMGMSTNNKAVFMWLYRRPLFYFSLGAKPPNHPEIELHGVWKNPDIVLDDHGSLSREFTPDARLYNGPPQLRPPARETAQIIFREGARARFDDICKVTN